MDIIRNGDVHIRTGLVRELDGKIDTRVLSLSGDGSLRGLSVGPCIGTYLGADT